MILHLLGMLTCLIIVLVIGYRIWNSDRSLNDDFPYIPFDSEL